MQKLINKLFSMLKRLAALFMILMALTSIVLFSFVYFKEQINSPCKFLCFSSVGEHLNKAGGASKQSIEQNTAELRRKIREKRSNNDAYIDEITSFSMQAKYIYYHSVGNEEELQNLIMDKFYKHVLSLEELEQLIQDYVQRSLLDMDGYENELAVNVEQTLATHPIIFSKQNAYDYKLFSSDIVSLSNFATGRALMTTGLSFALSETVAFAVMRGAALSLKGTAFTIVSGLAIDYGLSKIDDSRAKLKRKLEIKVFELAQTVGRETKAKLEEELSHRVNTWNKTIIDLKLEQLGL